jgi:hypothetical protein
MDGAMDGEPTPKIPEKRWITGDFSLPGGKAERDSVRWYP